ncbi:hypothetical protein QYE76_071860 [Lolium multiflorum]|uniref:Uncharacterized protein n=1 Tax=Lolium multiflorum TaxID=4521 RepID=A0AAD8SKL9_LOLMU|nr:hypothetical protein QYE76_071860 [Lolium multiflorum]
MADHMSWEQVVDICRQLHPEEEEEVVAAGVEAQQLDLEVAAEAAERAEGRLAATRAEIANAMAELADARAELAEARAALAAPPADAVIHDIADDDPPCPGASSAPGPFSRAVEQENGSWRSPSPPGTAAAARDRARFVANVAAIQEEVRAAAVAAAAEEEARAAAEAAARKVAFAMVTALWDSSLAEALERRRRQDEMSVRRASGARSARSAPASAPAHPAASSRARDCE